MKNLLGSQIFNILTAGLLLFVTASAVPKIVGAETQATGSAAIETAVKMRPFKVLAEWIEIRPVRNKGVIDHIRIVHVQTGTPAADAGLLPGMQIVELQGIQAVGMGEHDFFERLQALPPASTLTLKVRTFTYNGSFAIIVPFIPAKPVGPDTQQRLIAAREVVPAEEAKARVASAMRVIDKEIDNLSRLGYESGFGLSDGVLFRSINRSAGLFLLKPYVREQLITELEWLLPGHLGLLCEAAAASTSTDTGWILRDLVCEAILRRTDYDSSQNVIVFRYLRKIPKLVTLLNQMNWFEGAEVPLAEGWKMANADTNGDVLGLFGSTYATIAARHGTLDALVAIARCTRAIDRIEGAKRNTLPSYAQAAAASEEAVLRAVVPLQSDNVMVLADFVIKNRRRLQFDAAKGVYLLKQ